MLLEPIVERLEGHKGGFFVQTAVADYHMHSNVSPDGHASMEDMCLAALRMGLKEVAVTDHYECYKPKIPYNPFAGNYIETYFKKLERCRAKFARKLRIRAGIELGQSFIDLKTEQQILKHYSYDYVIGSMHKINNTDLVEVDYPSEDVDAWCKTNLQNLLRMAEESDFDCLGHVDLIKRYAANRGVKVDLYTYREELSQVFERLIKRGKGIEINTSSLRQAAKEAMPSLQILKLYRSLGGKILTFGSDAHRPDDVGKGLDTALCMAKEAGFTEIALFENRQPHFVSIV